VEPDARKKKKKKNKNKKKNKDMGCTVCSSVYAATDTS
jgi:hypothetical protein